MAIKTYKNAKNNYYAIFQRSLEKKLSHFFMMLLAFSRFVYELMLNPLRLTYHFIVSVTSDQLKLLTGIATCSLQIITKDRMFRNSLHIRTLYNLAKSLQYSKFLDQNIYPSWGDFLHHFFINALRFALDLTVNLWSSGLWSCFLPFPSHPLFMVWVFLWMDAFEDLLRTLHIPANTYQKMSEILSLSLSFSLGMLTFSPYFLGSLWYTVLAVRVLYQISTQNIGQPSEKKDFFERILVAPSAREVVRNLRERLLNHLLLNGDIPLAVALGTVFFYTNIVIKEVFMMGADLIEKSLGVLRSYTYSRSCVDAADQLVVEVASSFFATPFDHIYLEPSAPESEAEGPKPFGAAR